MIEEERPAGATLPRRLTVADLAILIAGWSVGFAWLNVSMRRWTEYTTGYDVHSAITVSILTMSPFLPTTSAGLLVAGWRGPRDGLRERLARPGMVASLAIAGHYGADATLTILHTSIGYLGDFQDFAIGLLFGGQGAGGLVAIAWVTLVLARAWRPEAGWIDRSGRALGLIAICYYVLFHLTW